MRRIDNASLALRRNMRANTHYCEAPQVASILTSARRSYVCFPVPLCPAAAGIFSAPARPDALTSFKIRPRARD
jgi:hypothetical protein